MKIKLDKIKEITGYDVKTNFKSLGLDIAERTGVCNIETTDKYATLSFNFVEFDKSDIKEVYKNMYNTFKVTITDQDLVVIEDSYLQYFGRYAQADVFKKLTRFGSLALANSLEKKIQYEFILAKSSRAKLKILTTAKAGYGKGQSKKAVADWLKNNLDIDLKGDDDASDAVVLALLGILEGLDFRSEKDIKDDKSKE